jgi:hypothetical protein
MKTTSKRIRKPTAKVTADSPGSDSISDAEGAGKRPKARRVLWSTPRTERLLDWLEENPEDRQKLFSDSSKDAKDEGRRRRVAKSPKSEFHKMIATYVFSTDDDPTIREDFRSNPGNYTKSVDNYIIRLVFFFLYFFICLCFFYRLRKEYRSFNEQLGQTGAGLRPEDITEGTPLHNLVGK